MAGTKIDFASRTCVPVLVIACALANEALLSQRSWPRPPRSMRGRTSTPLRRADARSALAGAGSSSVSAASGRTGLLPRFDARASFAGATALATRSSAAWGCCWASFEAVTTTASTAASMDTCTLGPMSPKAGSPECNHLARAGRGRKWWRARLEAREYALPCCDRNAQAASSTPRCRSDRRQPPARRRPPAGAARS